MESEVTSTRGVWWRGALTSAVKGLPQGLLLGGIGFALIVGGIYAAGALGFGAAASGVASSFGSFLFSGGAAASAAFASGLPAFSFSLLNPLPFIALNTALTMVGNFLTGGDIAVAKHQQEVDHARNEARINAIEGREMLLEQAVDTLHPNTKWLDILQKGPRAKTGFVAAEEAAAAEPVKAPVLH